MAHPTKAQISEKEEGRSPNNLSLTLMDKQFYSQENPRKDHTGRNATNVLQYYKGFSALEGDYPSILNIRKHDIKEKKKFGIVRVCLYLFYNLSSPIFNPVFTF